MSRSVARIKMYPKLPFSTIFTLFNSLFRRALIFAASSHLLFDLFLFFFLSTCRPSETRRFHFVKRFILFSYRKGSANLQTQTTSRSPNKTLFAHSNRHHHPGLRPVDAVRLVRRVSTFRQPNAICVCIHFARHFKETFLLFVHFFFVFFIVTLIVTLSFFVAIVFAPNFGSHTRLLSLFASISVPYSSNRLDSFFFFFYLSLLISTNRGDVHTPGDSFRTTKAQTHEVATNLQRHSPKRLSGMRVGWFVLSYVSLAFGRFKSAFR